MARPTKRKSNWVNLAVALLLALPCAVAGATRTVSMDTNNVLTSGAIPFGQGSLAGSTNRFRYNRTNEAMEVVSASGTNKLTGRDLMAVGEELRLSSGNGGSTRTWVVGEDGSFGNLTGVHLDIGNANRVGDIFSESVDTTSLTVAGSSALNNAVGTGILTNLVNLPTVMADYYADKPWHFLVIGDQSSYFPQSFFNQMRSAGVPFNGGLGLSGSPFTAGTTNTSLVYVTTNWPIGQWNIGPGGMVTNYSSYSNNIIGNRIKFAANYGPNQGVLTLYTGRWAQASSFAPLATIDLESGGPWGDYITNFAVPDDVYTLVFSNHVSGTESNILFYTGCYKTNGAGIIYQGLGSGAGAGTDIAAHWTLSNTNILWPLMQSLEANFVMLYQLDYSSVTNGFRWAMTNMLTQVRNGAAHDIVLAGHFPIHGGTDARGQNAIARDVAAEFHSLGARYFDGHPDGWGTNMMVQNGFLADAVHTSAAGSSEQAKLFHAWSGYLPQLISGDITNYFDHQIVSGTLSLAKSAAWKTNFVTYASTVNVPLDGPQYLYLDATGNLALNTTNRPTGQGRGVTLFLSANGAARTITLNSNWRVWGTNTVVTVASGKEAYVALYADGPTESNVRAQIEHSQ